MANYNRIDTMDFSVPQGTEQLSQADDHIRGVKEATKGSFPNLAGAVTANDQELNTLTGYPSDVDVDDRFTAIENILGLVTNPEMQGLYGYLIGNGNIESRFDAVAAWIGNVTQLELSQLEGYNDAAGKIEPRFQGVEGSIVGINTDIYTLYNGVQQNFDSIGVINTDMTQNQRRAAATFNQKTYLTGYNRDDLGGSFQLATQKIAAIEDFVGIDSPTGTAKCAWTNLLWNLGQGTGGINVTNTENTRERFGCVLTGLAPNSPVSFYFTINGQTGPTSADVNNGTKLIQTSTTGDANIYLSLGGANDVYGLNGNRLPTSGIGQVTMVGIDKNSGASVFFTATCVFYDDPANITPPVEP